MHTDMTRDKRFLLLAALAAATLLPFLGLTDFYTKGEPREAVVAYSMLETGDWVLPVNNGGDMAYKPPMFHWAVAAASALAGGVSEYTSRLPSALALIALVLAGYRFHARRRGSEDAALVAGLVLLTSFETHRAGTNCRVDMLLTAFVVLALYRLCAWCEGGRRGFPWGAAALMGCAALTKGPVGILLPCLVTGAWMLVRGAGLRRTAGATLGVGAAACVLPALWYAAAWRQGGDEFLALVAEENFGRFLGRMSYESHENPVWYNFASMAAGFLPYTLLPLFALCGLRLRRPSAGGAAARLRAWARGAWARLRAMDDARLFSLLSAAVVFAFYCVPKSKRSVYLLPVYPFAAYFLAEWMLRLARGGARPLRTYAGVLAALGVTLTAALAAVRLGWVPDGVFRGRHAAENVAYLHALRDAPLGFAAWLLAVLPGALGAAVLVRLRWRRRTAGGGGARTLGAAAAMAFALFLALDGVCQPPVLCAKSDRGMAEDIRRIVPEGRIYSYANAPMMRFYVVNFYLGDRVEPLGPAAPGEGYVLARKRDAGDLLRDYAGVYSFEEVYRSRKRACDVRDTVCLYSFSRR